MGAIEKEETTSTCQWGESNKNSEETNNTEETLDAWEVLDKKEKLVTYLAI